MLVKLYTDGSCQGNPGPAGWGYVLLTPPGPDGPNAPIRVRECFGMTLNEQDQVVKCTNQQSEMTAALRGLTHIIEKMKSSDYKPKTIQLCSDSAYLLNCLKDKWYLKWRRTGWITSKKEPVINVWLWERLINCIETLHANGVIMEYIKVKAHQKPGSERYDEWNDLADQLANKGTQMAVVKMATEIIE